MEFFNNSQSGRLPHAVLLECPWDTALAAAMRLARAAVCEPQDASSPRPCGKCRHCVKSQSGNHPDILVYSVPPGAKSFPVDLIRRLRTEAYIRPNEAACKVYVLPDAQLMTEQAQNALLKVLEEPPAEVVFVLTCDNKANLLGTVRSRCTLLPVQETPSSAHTQEPPTSCLPENFAKALCGTSRYAFLALSGHYEKDSAALALFVRTLPVLFRDALSARLGAGGTLGGMPESAQLLASRLTKRQLASLTETALRAGREAQRYVNTTLLLCWLFDRLWLDAHS